MGKETIAPMGNVHFIDDVWIDGMLHCVALRSRIRRGRIRSLTVPPLPNGVFFIDAGDVPGRNAIRLHSAEIPILADGRVSHPGQAIALLCGPDELELQHLLERIEVHYDRETPYELRSDFSHEQLRYSRVIAVGNTAAAFERAFHIVEGEYRIEPGHIRVLHPIGAVAYRNREADVRSDARSDVRSDARSDARGIEVISPTKWLYHLRASVAAALGVSPEEVRAKSAFVTKSHGGGTWYPSIIAAQTAIATTVTGKPVRMILTPVERRLLTARRPGCLAIYKTALSKKGAVTAMEIRAVAESGAFSTFPTEQLDRLCMSLAGHYACKSVKISGALIETNLPPVDTHGGFGFSTGFFAT